MHIYLCEVTRFKETERKATESPPGRRNGRMVTSHDGRFLLGSLQILLRQFEVKVNADMLLLQLGEPSSKITRPLQSERQTFQSTEIRDGEGKDLL